MRFEGRAELVATLDDVAEREGNAALAEHIDVFAASMRCAVGWIDDV